MSNAPAAYICNIATWHAMQARKGKEGSLYCISVSWFGLMKEPEEMKDKICQSCKSFLFVDKDLKIKSFGNQH